MPETNSDNQKNTTSFLDKLYNILENEPNDVISWCKNGDSFIITDPELFSQTIMGKYFKTSKFNSFVRQLNFYGFRKVSRDSPSDDKSVASKIWEFKHPNFKKGEKDLLAKIHRKQVGENDPEIEARFESMTSEIQFLKRQVADLLQWKDSVQASMNLYNIPREKKMRFDYDTLSLPDYEGIDKPMDSESYFDNGYNPYSTWTNFNMPSYNPSPSITDPTNSRFFTTSNSNINTNNNNENTSNNKNGIKIPLTSINTTQTPTEIPVKIGNNNNNNNNNSMINPNYSTMMNPNGMSHSIPVNPSSNHVNANMNPSYAGIPISNYQDTTGYPDDYLNAMGYNRPPASI